jgi:hypothetical protein
MPRLLTDKFDKIMTERKVQKMSEVDRLLAMTETHYGLSLIGEQRVEQMMKKLKEKTKETSSTSPQAEEILGETVDRLGGYQDRAPHGDYGDHMNDVFDREPHM